MYKCFGASPHTAVFMGSGRNFKNSVQYDYFQKHIEGKIGRTSCLNVNELDNAK